MLVEVVTVRYPLLTTFSFPPNLTGASHRIDVNHDNCCAVNGFVVNCKGGTLVAEALPGGQITEVRIQRSNSGVQQEEARDDCRATFQYGAPYESHCVFPRIGQRRL